MISLVRETLSLHNLISANSEHHSEAVALLAPNCRPLTYGELLYQVEYVGNALRTLGIERSDRVAVVLPNGPNMAAAFLGIAACATCAPLNPGYRREEFEFYLRDLGIRAIVLPADTEMPVREVAVQLGLTVLELEPSTTQLAGAFTLRGAPAEVETPPDWGRNDDIALVLHTSGTTSRPKQVPLSHHNVCSSAHNIARFLELSPDDICLNVMPLFHAHGLISVLFPSMFAGAAVACSAGFDYTSFADLMGEFEPTWYSAVPTIHHSVLSLAKENPAVTAGGHLRLIRSNSASLPPTVMAELEETFQVPVIETYGLSEATGLTGNPLPPAQRKSGSVGLPIRTERFPLRMAIMDNEGQLLSAGETGEIVVRGPSVMSGYANNPEANEAAFTDGWFRTGDRGRTDSDGYLYVTGRMKEMINRGGESISPREIDEVLLEHPAVAQAVAFAVPHVSLGEDVAVAAVLQKDCDLSEQDLREFAFTRLADFKVPSQIVFVDAIPTGPTGKLQRIGLHQELTDELRRESVPPRTEMEGMLVEIWREVLPVDQIGVHDNFFGSGGDSLAAGRLIARINSRFELDVAVSSVFRSPSVETQALLVESVLIDELECEEQR